MKADYAARLNNFAERAWWTFLDLLFPPRCANCQRMGERLCALCRAEISYVNGHICQQCGYPLKTNTPTTNPCDQCRRIPFAGLRLRSLALHTGPLRKAIHALKYRHNPALAQALAELMAQRWPAYLPDDAVLMPVPLSLERMQERGFNQAELLARQLSQYRRIPINTQDLQRTRATRTQVGLTANQRRQNVSGAFIADVQLTPNLTIILIDDVCTTGATLSACADALLQAGASQVWAYTLARAPLDDADKLH